MHCWSYVHASPSSPVGSLQKHLPSAHCWPSRHDASPVHAAPLVTWIDVELDVPMSSNTRISTSMTPSGKSSGGSSPKVGIGHTLPGPRCSGAVHTAQRQPLRYSSPRWMPRCADADTAKSA